MSAPGAALRFDGKVAIVTGAGRGLGRAHALELAARGAAVVVNDLGAGTRGDGSSAGPAREVVEEIRAAGGQAVASIHSVATEEGGAAIVATALETFGRLDVVVNNAGIADSPWTVALDVHLSGAFWTCKAAWPLFTAQGSGRIVNTTSSAGLFGLVPPAGGGLEFHAYGAAKAGVVGLTRNLALDGERHGILANVVAPVAHSRLTALHPDPLVVEWLASNFPAERVTPAVIVLAHESCAVTGRVFTAGGGRVAEVFTAETEGFADTDLTAERLVAAMPRVLDRSVCVEPRDAPDETIVFDRVLRGRGLKDRTVLTVSQQGTRTEPAERERVT